MDACLRTEECRVPSALQGAGGGGMRLGEAACALLGRGGLDPYGPTTPPDQTECVQAVGREGFFPSQGLEVDHASPSSDPC